MYECVMITTVLSRKNLYITILNLIFKYTIFFSFDSLSIWKFGCIFDMPSIIWKKNEKEQ